MDTAGLFFHSTWVGRQNAGSYRCNYHFDMALLLPDCLSIQGWAKQLNNSDMRIQTYRESAVYLLWLQVSVPIWTIIRLFYKTFEVIGKSIHKTYVSLVR